MPSPTIEIAKREFLEHVLSSRFLIALVLSSLILVTSVVALGAAYEEDRDAYASQQDALGQSDDSFSTTLREMHRHLARPNLLSIFVGGPGDAYRAQEGDVGFEGPLQQQTFEPQGGSSSPANTRFDPLDLGFVAAVVMTFMAVIFSFDAVSGEKERGTLKLVLANPVPKDAVLLGKYLGGLASILIPFAISLVLGLATLAFLGIDLPAGAWTRLATILGLTILLLSAFYLVGLLVSSLSRRSSTALLTLTLVWLVLVFGVGNVAAVVAKETTPTTSGADLQAQERAINDAASAEAEPYQEQIFALFQKRQQGNLTAEEEQRLQVAQTETDRIYGEAEEKREALRTTALRQLDDQLRRAEAISSVSPAESFRSLATAVARSDYWSFREATAAAEEYQREVERARAEWEEDHPTGGFGNARMVTIGPGGVRTIGDDFEPPVMHYEPASLKSQLVSGASVRDLLVLLAYNLGAFVAAYVAFLRYDVR